MVVSVIIPIYNIQDYLENCLNSCRKQTYRNIEFICVDDGSTDDSGMIADRFAAADPRFRVVHKTNGGLPSARKAGLKEATGDYIFHLDGDDELPDYAIELLAQEALAKDVDIVIGNYRKIESGRGTYHTIDFAREGTGEQYLEFILERGIFNIWGKLIRRSLYDNTIVLPEAISIGEDLIHSAQLAYYARRVSRIDGNCYYYYIRSSSMSKEDKDIPGILTNRSIYAVDFVRTFLGDKVGESVRCALDRYIALFINQYFNSPYSVDERRNELRELVSFIKLGNLHPASCRLIGIAKVSLDLAKAMVAVNRRVRSKS